MAGLLACASTSGFLYYTAANTLLSYLVHFTVRREALALTPLTDIC